MVDDTLQKSEPPKPCCSALEKKLSKSEMGRAALKQAIALYDKKVSELETENLNLKKGTLVVSQAQFLAVDFVHPHFLITGGFNRSRASIK